jgi:glycosyltransferase involved in cell wall biosynthesis
MKMKLKILYIIPVMGLGGAEKMLGDICFEMNSRGHQVKVVSLHEPHFSFERYPRKEEFIKLTQFEIINFTTSLHPQSLGINIDSKEYHRILHEFKPDIIHSHLFESELISHAYHYPHAKYFSHVHDNMYQLEDLLKKSRKKRSIAEYFERNWIRKKYKQFNNTFIAISQDTLNFTRRVLPAKLKNRVHLVKNAINYKAYANTIDRSIGNRTIKLISVGNLVPKKNHQLLISVCDELQKRGIDFTCDILGFGKLNDELQKQIDSCSLTEKVILRGSVPNVHDYLNEADIYVHPANYEPFGLVILEAMAAGLPVVCRNGNGNKDIHVEGETGYMIEDDNVTAFADKISYLSEHPDVYKKMSLFVREFSKQYDIEVYAEKLLHLYQS